ncbi:Nuclear control of ATPase protein 2 [Geranomyces michiganensis]|nr:Nuclear control of ATPase protein 2 [Geranomyces michiganensis]
MGFVSERLSSQLRAIDVAFQLDSDHFDVANTFAVFFGSRAGVVGTTGASGSDIDLGGHPEAVQMLWEALLSQALTPPLSKRPAEGTLAHDHLPPLTTVGKHLAQIHEMLYADMSSAETASYPLAELAFLAKATAVLHAHLLHNLLAESTTLTPDIGYWRDQEISSLRAAYYLLQTLPDRIYRYSRMLYAFLQAHQSSHLRPRFRMFSTKLSRRLTSKRSALRVPSTGFVGLSIWKLQAPPTIVELAKQEIRLKREKLETVRQTQAGCLGLLAVEDHETEAVVKRESFATAIDAAALEEAAKETQLALSKTLALLSGVIEKMQKVEGELSPEDDEHARSADFADLEATVASVTVQPIPLLHQQARAIYGSLQHHELTFKRLMQKHGRPSPLARRWVPVTSAVFIAYQFGSALAVRWDDVKAWAEDVKETAYDFFVEWIVKPLENIYVTVRHKETRLSLSSAGSLAADLESLERMVVDYAKDQGVTDADKLRLIAQQAQIGDLSVVLQRYAEEIKSPLKNAVSGDLIRALLIQIQKAKVDGEVAIDALDKLLRSNELNFAFLAVTPSLLISWLIGKKLAAVLSGGKEKTKAQAYEYIRGSLRNIDRILNKCNTRNRASKLPYKAHGLLLCEVYLLRKYVPVITRKHSYRQRFMEDLRELESGFKPEASWSHADFSSRDVDAESAEMTWTVSQRMETVRRMFRTYPFLQPGA